MYTETFDEKEQVFLYTDNLGTQPKFFRDGYWYKVNMTGCEGISETLASTVLSCSDSVDYVAYESCTINGKPGCVSENFLTKGCGEQFLSLDILYKNLTGDSLADKIFSIPDVEDRFTFLVNMVWSATGLDITTYLQDILALDMLIRNPDRHFGNLGIIRDEDGNFRPAPIFDNGQGLGGNFQITPPMMTTEEKLEALSAATISGSFERAHTAAGGGFHIDYQILQERLKDVRDCPAKHFLEQQLKTYRREFDKPLRPDRFANCNLESELYDRE